MTHAPSAHRHGDRDRTESAATRLARRIGTTLRGAHRKRRAIWIGVAIAALVAVGVLEAATIALEAQLAVRRGDLASVQELGARYRALRTALDAIDRSTTRPGPTSASLWTLVEAAARSTVGAQRVASLTPTEAEEPHASTGMPGDASPGRQGLELHVEGAALGPIIDLLHTLEQATTPLDVRRLHLTRATSTDGTLDATLAIVGSVPAR